MRWVRRWRDHSMTFLPMIGPQVGRCADWARRGDGEGVDWVWRLPDRHLGALRPRRGAGPFAWRFGRPVEGGQALRVSGGVVAGYWQSFEEVEDTAHSSVESSQGLGNLEPTRLDEADGEASQAGGVFGAVAGADAASVFIP